MRSLRRILFLLVPVLFLAGCGARQGTPSAADPQTRTTVRVENRSWSAVNVYAVRAGGSQRVRLGTVQAVSTQVLTIPRQVVAGVSRLQFLIDPIGSSRTPLSQEISVREGDEITLYVPNA
ncbi:MAG TPA: hypothetical protein VGR37_02260 [Longimicrobiaceae bacterium]|nr:hypothetical protein [Longimicrobiaceae bacterium]